MKLFQFTSPAPAPGGGWLDVIEAPAAMFSPAGRFLAGNAAWAETRMQQPPPQGAGQSALDAALIRLGDAAAAFRLSKAARRGQSVSEVIAGQEVRLHPVEGGVVLSLPSANVLVATPPSPAAATPLAASPPHLSPVDPSRLSELGALIDAAPMGIARLSGSDPQTAILRDVNPAFARIAGGGAGQRLADLVAEPDRTALSLLTPGADKPVDLTLAAESGRVAECWLLADGSSDSVLILVDVTARREMEQRLAQGSKMQAIGQIAGGVAHELNNLLQVIELNADSLLTRHPVGDPSYGELQRIKQTNARAAELVKMLLAYSRKQTFRRDVMEIGGVLSEFAVLMRQVLDERVRLDIVHGRDLPQVRADKQQLETVFMNLVTNARDAVITAGRPGGRIELKTRRGSSDDVRAALKGEGVHEVTDGDWAVISVTDNGTGMPPEIAAQIFEPFFTTKEANKGTGIGMATVYGIVKQSEGFIALQTEPDVGTTFHIFLPAAKVEANAEPVAASAPAPAVEPRPKNLAGRGRILLVEDEDGVRDITASLLKQRGYEVECAEDGEMALEILQAEPGGFDLLISDVVMPNLDGPGLLEAARAHLGQARVVFMSGYAEQDFARTLEGDRAVSFLPKPFTLQQLAETVKRELAA